MADGGGRAANRRIGEMARDFFIETEGRLEHYGSRLKSSMEMNHFLALYNNLAAIKISFEICGRAEEEEEKKSTGGSRR